MVPDTFPRVEHETMKESQFHNYERALEFDSRSMSDIRVQLADRLIEAMSLRRGERLLDVATGTGRFARPVSRHLPAGTIVGSISGKSS